MLEKSPKTITFQHDTIAFPTLKQINGDIRLYETPGGNQYPSMTTVLKQLDDGGLDVWRKRVGKSEAERVVKDASGRGDLLHKMCEDYLNNQLNLQQYNARLRVLFKLIHPVLNKITLVRALEARLYSDKYHIAGTVDCIGELEKILSVIDFKGSTQPIDKKSQYGRRKLFKYMLQACGYSLMLEEMTGIKAKQLVVLVAVQRLRKCQVFKTDREKFVKEFNLCLNSYHKDPELIQQSLFWRL